MSLFVEFLSQYGPSAATDALVDEHAPVLIDEFEITQPIETIVIDGVDAQAVDPLFLMEHARFFDETAIRATRVEARTLEVETSRGTKGSVTITTSPSRHSRPSARPRWKVSVVMFAPNTISSGEPPIQSASARRASRRAWSVSSLVGNAQCVLALW